MCFLIRSNIASNQVQKVNGLPGKCSYQEEGARMDKAGDLSRTPIEPTLTFEQNRTFC